MNTDKNTPQETLPSKRHSVESSPHPVCMYCGGKMVYFSVLSFNTPIGPSTVDRFICIGCSTILQLLGDITGRVQCYWSNPVNRKEFVNRVKSFSSPFKSITGKA